MNKDRIKIYYYSFIILVVILAMQTACRNTESVVPGDNITSESINMKPQQQIQTTDGAVIVANKGIPFYYEPIDEFSFRMYEFNNKYFSLGDKDLKLAESTYKDKKTQTKYTGNEYSDFITDVVFNVNEDEFLNIKTQNLNKTDASSAQQIVYYIGTSIAYIESYRGVSIGSYDYNLRRLYPDDLYYVEKSFAKNKAVGNLDNLDFEYAYAYMPLNGNNYDITFYMKEDRVVFIEMNNGFEEARWKGCKLVNGKNKPCELEIETIADYHLVVPITQAAIDEDGEQSEYVNNCYFDFKIPKAGKSVPNGELIDKEIMSDQYLDDVNQLKSGDYSMIYERGIGNESIDYAIYNYGNLRALVVFESGSVIDWDGFSRATIWYFDCDRGQFISARQYAKMVGVNEKEIIDAYNECSSFVDIDNVYQANFYMDSDKKVQVYENYID